MLIADVMKELEAQLGGAQQFFAGLSVGTMNEEVRLYWHMTSKTALIGGLKDTDCLAVPQVLKALQNMVAAHLSCVLELASTLGVQTDEAKPMLAVLPEVPTWSVPPGLVEETERAIAKLAKDDFLAAVYKWVNRCCSSMKVGRERDYVEAACVRFAIGLIMEGYEGGCKKAGIKPKEIALLLQLVMQGTEQNKLQNSEGNGHEDQQ